MGITGADFAFNIPEEKDSRGNSINAEIFWLRFKKPEDRALPNAFSVEGKLYTPKTNNNKQLILFTPGFPGGNAGRFEQIYARAFINAGYSFFTLRHNGTNLLKSDTAPEILNSPKRIEIAQALGTEHIGGEKKIYTPSEIVEETATPLLDLAGEYEQVHLMGQSMGVAASYNAVSRLERHPEILNKIGNIVGISGYIGKDKGTEGPLWDGLKMPIDDLARLRAWIYKKSWSQYGYKFGADFKDAMKQVAERNSQMQIPDHIGNILVFITE